MFSLKACRAVVCAVALATVVTVFAQTTVAGAWALEMRWPGGPSTGACTFTQDGETLTGTCGGDTDRFPVTGRVSGTKLSWQVEVKQGDAQGRMEFTGEIDQHGSTITGLCSVGDQFGSFTMRRV
jgi:hypothetical protein